MTVTFTLEVDWNKDGAYTAESAYAKKITIRRGRRTSITTGGYVGVDVGSLSVEAKNTDKRYDIFNASSPLYGYLLPNRPIRVKATQGATTWTIFAGKTSNIRPQRRDKTAYIEGQDESETLRKQKAEPVAIELNGAVSGKMENILTQAGWSGATSIPNNGDVIPVYWSGRDKTVWNICEDLSRAFAGDIFIKGDGTFRYQPRATSYTSKYTLQDDSVLYDADMEQPWSEVRNRVSITGHPLKLSSTVEMWRLNDTPLVKAGETRTFDATVYYNGRVAPISGFDVPNATTDYTANTQEGGGGTDKTAFMSVSVVATGPELALQVENTGTVDFYITLLKIHGEYYIDENPITVTVEDTTSQSDYGIQTFELDAPWLQTLDDVTNHANMILSLFKDPRRVLWAMLRGDFSKQFDLELFDIITLNVANFGMTGVYQVSYIEHVIKPGQDFVTTLRLEPYPGAGLWIFTAILETSTVLGW